MTMLLGPIVVPTLDADRLIVNTSSSAPLGFYIRAETELLPGNLLIVRLPEPLAKFAHRRRFLEYGWLLLKSNAAKPGDRICRFANEISLNGSVVAIAMASDAHDRPLPKWQGCFALRSDQVFLLSSKHSSFDSRYFGALDRATVLGSAIALLTFGD